VIVDFEIFLALSLGEFSRHFDAGTSFRTLRKSRELNPRDFRELWDIDFSLVDLSI
jgi:hypothetical protein